MKIVILSFCLCLTFEHPIFCFLLLLGEYSSASDVYAFTIMLNEMLLEEVPFPLFSVSEIWTKVATQKMRPKAYTASVADAIGCRLMNLIRSGWNQDRSLRMSFQALAVDLNQLLTAAVEIARNGAIPSTTNVGEARSGKGSPSPAQSLRTAEAAIALLSEWLTSSCGLLEDDGALLAHTLVTTKSITSVELLSEILPAQPELLTHDLKVPAAHDVQVKKALQKMKKQQLQLVDLTVEQVCALLDSHRLHSSIKPIVLENEISGIVLMSDSF
jgi:serine/threonine protein kinase